MHCQEDGNLVRKGNAIYRAFSKLTERKLLNVHTHTHYTEGQQAGKRLG